MGTYLWSPRHAAQALHAVASQAIAICWITSALGASLSLTYVRERPNVAGVCWLLITLNAVALWAYLGTHTAAYA
jgi:hypothetical protein